MVRAEQAAEQARDTMFGVVTVKVEGLHAPWVERGGGVHGIL